MEAKTLRELKRIYSDVGIFSAEGLAWAETWDGKYLHIHPDGTPAYEQRYDHAFSFSSGIALVVSGTRRFHIHTDGAEVKESD